MESAVHRTFRRADGTLGVGFIIPFADCDHASISWPDTLASQHPVPHLDRLGIQDVTDQIDQPASPEPAITMETRSIDTGTNQESSETNSGSDETSSDSGETIQDPSEPETSSDETQTDETQTVETETTQTVETQTAETEAPQTVETQAAETTTKPKRTSRRKAK